MQNWKASTLKRLAHSADHKVCCCKGCDFVLFSFNCVWWDKKESCSHTLCTELQIPKLTNVWSSTNEIRRMSTFVSIRNPFTLLIDLSQFIDNKWLLNSLHHSQVLYNDITKKTCMIPDARSKPLHFPPKTHVAVMIEIITAKATHTWKLWIYFKQLNWTFNNWDDCMFQES